MKSHEIESVLAMQAQSSGRTELCRSAFAWRGLPLVIGTFALAASGVYTLSVPLAVIVHLILGLLVLTATLNRLNNLQRSGWWALLGFLPGSCLLLYICLAIWPTIPLDEKA